VVELEVLERKAMVDCVGLGVTWEEYREGSLGWQSMLDMLMHCGV
jgi:hypothetical protein